MLLLNFSFFIPGVILPLLILHQNTDPTGFNFSFICFTIYLLIISFTLISEADNLITSKTESEVLTVMPINTNILVRAKMFMYTRYLFLLSFPLFLPGSIFYYYLFRSLPRAVVFYISAYMLCYFICLVILFLYSAAVNNTQSKKVGSYTLYFQLLMIFIIIIVYQYISYGISGLPNSNINDAVLFLQSKNLINFFPQSWFAFLTAKAQYQFELALILKIILPVVIVIASFYSLKLYLEENILSIQNKFLNVKAIEKENYSIKNNFFVLFINNFIYKNYLRNNSERASYLLLSKLNKKDKNVKLAFLPMILIPIGLAFFALITNQLPNPFSNNYFEQKPVFHISILISILVVLNASFISLKITSYPGVSWIYNALPINTVKAFRNGIRKYFVINLILPITIGIFLILIFAIPLNYALLHIIFTFVIVNFYNSILNIFSRTLPFTKENTLINSIQKISSVIISFLIGIIFVIIQLLVYNNIKYIIFFVLAVLILTFFINYLGFRSKL